jgi:hypothetical protein
MNGNGQHDLAHLRRHPTFFLGGIVPHTAGEK